MYGTGGNPSSASGSTTAGGRSRGRGRARGKRGRSRFHDSPETPGTDDGAAAAPGRPGFWTQQTCVGPLWVAVLLATGLVVVLLVLLCILLCLGS